MGGAVPIEAILPLTGAVNAAILAVAISLRQSGLGVLFYAATLLMIVAAVIFVIVADHAGIASFSGAERLLTLACGPVFLLFVGTSLRWSLDWRVVGAPAVGVCVADQASTILFDSGLSFWLIVVVQVAYTFVALFIALKHRSDGLRSNAQRKQLILWVIGLMLLVHAAQAVRFVAPDVTQLRNLVPNVAGAGVLLLAVLVFLSARLPVVDLLAPGRQPERNPEALAAVVARLEQALREGGLARRADLRVADAAAVVGVSARDIASALAEAKGTSFSEYLVKARVEIALKLLREPAEQRTSMEAIGLLAGFGSRSAFYSAFSRHVGETPSAFRKRLSEDTCPDS
ncbi:MAG: helix-turn-helix domain-containing protein [Alphaproteobacteria bacterium]|nr:helix-turn-helix domain-containing protein [Alphaproteobacteria bacterium]